MLGFSDVTGNQIFYASWPNSYHSYSPSDSVSQQVSSENHPDFVIPRQGPGVTIDPEIINKQRQFWQHCLVGVLYDEGPVQDFHMQASINEYWHLQNPVRVVGRKKNIFMFEFDNVFDKNFMVQEGPWTVQNKLLILKNCQPNIILEEYKVHEIPIWVEFWGFPLEYYVASVAEEVGNMVGDVLQVDFSDQGFRNLRYLRFRCGCIGHLARESRKSKKAVQKSIDEQK
ncbi:uncharacterized protein G2W53_029013 [Senna tora]|uniref:DUF4283 domain-containing protein n=1 Tax=Senna tora TaxID=362788 RepID=A0A834WFC0_9FABA|nr:uncharacterized protein G2W53_029013 [Senna tora]